MQDSRSADSIIIISRALVGIKGFDSVWGLTCVYGQFLGFAIGAVKHGTPLSRRGVQMKPRIAIKSGVFDRHRWRLL
jgi:hypothetical protein